MSGTSDRQNADALMVRFADGTFGSLAADQLAETEAARDLKLWAGSLKAMAKRALREIPNAADMLEV